MQKQSKQNNNILDSQNNNNVDEKDKLNEGKQEEYNTFVNLNYITIGNKYCPISLNYLKIFSLFLKAIIKKICANDAVNSAFFYCMLDLQNDYSGSILLSNQQDIGKRINKIN